MDHGMDDHGNLWPGIHPEDSSIFLRPGRRSARNQYVARRNGTPLRGLRRIYSDNSTSKMPKLKTRVGETGCFCDGSLIPIIFNCQVE